MRGFSQHRRSFSARLGQYAVLLLPTALLAVLAFHLDSMLLAIAAVFTTLLPVRFAKAPNAWRPPTSGPVVLVYLVVLALVVWTSRNSSDVTVTISRGLLFLAIVALLACHDLHRSGSEPRRRARKLCARLQGRQSWPGDLLEIRHLPEVYALQDAIAIEPGPVFDLFHDSRAEIRAAAFAAFIGRRSWRPRESTAVLDAARKTKETPVRVIAVAALGNVDDPDIIAGLADFYHDPSTDVRAAAIWASLADGGKNWAMVRDAIRSHLCDPRSVDAALPGAAGLLPVVAICDLTTWAGEPDPLGTRSIRTLIDHYNCLLQTTGDYDLITDLTNQVLDSATTTALRVELAGLLRGLGLLTPELLDRMSNADQPGSVRLLAAEAMLMADPYHPDGLDVLRGLGRQPNREMAITIAVILQSRLGFDMGIPEQGLKPNSKQAGEVVKRVMAWAVARGGDRRTATPTPGEIKSHPPLLPVTPHPEDAPELAMPPLRKLTSNRPGPW